MKRLLLGCIVALAMLLSKPTNAQTPDTSTIQGLPQYILNALNKTNLTRDYP